MKNKSNIHYTAPISEQITATAIFREHVYFKNKHAGPSFYLGSWPNTFLNFSSEKHEHVLKQKVATSWKSVWSGVFGQIGKREKKKKKKKSPQKPHPNPQNKETNEKPF